MTFPAQFDLAIPSKQSHVFFSIPLPFLFFFSIWFSTALALVVICTDGLYRSKQPAISKTAFTRAIKQGIFLQAMKSLPQKLHWD